jgi:hypothetical protein
MNNLELKILLINGLLFAIMGVIYNGTIAGYNFYFSDYPLFHKINFILFLLISLGMLYHFVRLFIMVFSL